MPFIAEREKAHRFRAGDFPEIQIALPLRL
jgi:hypothetical protein